MLHPYELRNMLPNIAPREAAEAAAKYSESTQTNTLCCMDGREGPLVPNSVERPLSIIAANFGRKMLPGRTAVAAAKYSKHAQTKTLRRAGLRAGGPNVLKSYSNNTLRSFA